MRCCFCLSLLAGALRKAGYGAVNLLSDYRAAGLVVQTGEGEAREIHLPPALRGTDLLVLDERIDGRSAFELHAALRTAAEFGAVATAILLNKTDEGASPTAMLAAWSSGFDLCLTKPVDAGEFQRFAEKLRTRGE